MGLMPPGWHEDDVAGRIPPEGYNGESAFIDCRNGNQRYFVCIPAEAERADDVPGRAIAPPYARDADFEQFTAMSRIALPMGVSNCGTSYLRANRRIRRAISSPIAAAINDSIKSAIALSCL